MYIHRHLESSFLLASEQYPVVMVCGARQVGKSTMLYHIKDEGRSYISLDDMNARRLAVQDPALFLDTYGSPLIIDEFQRAPEILLEIKKRVDKRMLEGEDCFGAYWLTGSQKFSMMKGISDSLAGRVAVFDLSGLTTAETEGRPPQAFSPELDKLKERLGQAKPKDIHQIYQRIFYGSMPRLVTGNIERDRFYSDYVSTYIERDIRELSQVGKIGQFYDFLVAMASRTGQEVKYTEIANIVGVSSPTIKSWVALLQESGIIYLLRPYASNLTKRLVKSPKMYFMDTGLAAYLCRWPTAETLEQGAMDGAFLETYVVTEILKSYLHTGKREYMYYYRDIDQREIDLLMFQGQKVFPLEIKKNHAPPHPDKNFHVLDKFGENRQTGIILCLSNELVPYSRTCWYAPVSLL